MPHRPSPRHFLSLEDLAAEELLALLERAEAFSRGARASGGETAQAPATGSLSPNADAAADPLRGRTLAMIFQKSSTRTRVSFEVGIRQLGGHGIFLAERDTQMGRGEPLSDTARVLSGYVDAIMIRTFRQADVEELARHSLVPVINGLTDLLHPCQLLADLLTVRQEVGPERLAEGTLKAAWIGDGNNMANSWLNAARLLGFELRIASPEGYDPDPEILAAARHRARVLLTRDPAEAAEGVQVVSTDVWASMGQEEEAEGRRAAFEPFRVTAELFERAAPGAIFLHCLPAHRGEEVDAAVIDGPRSRVFRQAENRLHAQKALLLHLMNPDHPSE